MKMKGKVLTLLIIVFMMLPVATIFSQGAAEPKADLTERTIEIGYTSPSFDISDVYEQYMIGMEERLEELGIDYDLRISSPARETQHDQQLRIIEDFVVMGVDFIVIGPTDFNISQRGIAEAAKAGIPTFVVNFASPHENEPRAKHYAGYLHQDGARVAADWVMDYLGGTGKVALIHGIPGEITEQRGYVFREILHDESDIEVVYEDYANFERQQAAIQTSAIISAYPDVDLIHAISTSMAMGSLATLREEGLVEQIPVIGWGGTIEEMDSIASGQLRGSVGRLPRDVGASIADAIWDVMNDREPGLSFAGPLVMLDGVDSIRKHMPADYYVVPQDR